MPFPAPRRYLPRGWEFGDYLDAYAERFNVPLYPHTNVRSFKHPVTGGGFRADTDDGGWLGSASSSPPALLRTSAFP